MNVTFIKSTVHVSYIVPGTGPRFLVEGAGWRLFGGGRLFQILSLRRGANSSIYGTFKKSERTFETPCRSLKFWYRPNFVISKWLIELYVVQL